MSLSDFHVHSVYSDGRLNLEEIIELAKERNIKNLALTDHDTINGVSEFLRMADNSGINAIAGVELTTEYREHRLDIIGYGIDPSNPALLSRLERLQIQRKSRNQRLLDRLLKLGFKIDLEKLEKEKNSKGGIGKQKITYDILANPENAKLISKFDQKTLSREYLERGGKAYIPLTNFKSTDAVKLIHECGGLASIAHPAQSVRNRETLALILRELATEGLDAVEVYSPKHESDDIDFLTGLAKELNLLTTFGSDFHGKDQMHADLGSLEIPGEEEITDEFLQSLSTVGVKS